MRMMLAHFRYTTHCHASKGAHGGRGLIAYIGPGNEPLASVRTVGQPFHVPYTPSTFSLADTLTSIFSRYDLLPNLACSLG